MANSEPTNEATNDALIKSLHVCRQTGVQAKRNAASSIQNQKAELAKVYAMTIDNDALKYVQLGMDINECQRHKSSVIRMEAKKIVNKWFPNEPQQAHPANHINLNQPPPPEVHDGTYDQGNAY